MMTSITPGARFSSAVAFLLGDAAGDCHDRSVPVLAGHLAEFAQPRV